MPGLDLRVLAYVYEATTPQCPLRKIFVYISVWFGNDHGFADPTSESSPEFHTDYALKRMKKARKEGLDEDTWDLTRFSVKEEMDADVKPKEKERDKTAPKQRRDSVTEERNTKRKKC
jgi:hypothetical protein